MKHKDLVTAYHTFWAGFQKQAQSVGLTAKLSNGGAVLVKKTGSKFIVESDGYFPDWKLKPSSTKRITILLTSREIYSGQTDIIESAAVGVCYCDVTKGSALPILSVHYDFEEQQKSAHPVFHAQFGKIDFDVKKFEQLGFTSSVGGMPKGQSLSTVRIPTACMNFVSVILGLAADHMPSATFYQVLKAVKASHLSTWDASCPKLRQSMASGRYFPSHHWYEEI